MLSLCLKNEGEKNAFNVPSWIVQRCTIISNFGEPSLWIWKCMFGAILLIKWDKWQCCVSEREYVHLAFKGPCVDCLFVRQRSDFDGLWRSQPIMHPYFWQMCLREKCGGEPRLSLLLMSRTLFLGIGLSRFSLRMHSIRHQIGSWTINRS